MVGDGTNGLKPEIPDMAKNAGEPKMDPATDPVATLFDSLDLKPPISPGRKGSASGETLLAPPTSFKVSPPTPLLGPSPCTCDPLTSTDGNYQTNSGDPDHLCPPSSAEHHDGNVSDGDGGDSVLKQAPNGIGLTRQTVHPEDHTDADSKWWVDLACFEV